MFALDGDWRFTYVNDEARDLLQGREETLRGERVWPWIDEEVRDVYRQTLQAAAKRGETVSTELRCPVHQRWFRVQAYPQREGVSVHLHDVGERVERERELTRREEALRRAHEVTTDREASPRQKIERLLSLIRGTLGTDVGVLSRRDEASGRFELLCVDASEEAPVDDGDRPPAAETLTCSEVVRTEQTLTIRDLEQQAPDLLGSSGIGAYVGAPVEVDGETFGTFCFFSSERRSKAFDEWETTYVDLFADWVGNELERVGGWPEPS